MKIPKQWTFNNQEIAEHFDDHVREQLPWYDLTTGIIAHIARHYVPEGGVVYDVGASTGNIGRAIEDTITNRNATFIAIDSSESMRSLYKGPGTFHVARAEQFDFQPFDLCICFLSLMFVAPAKRRTLLKKLSDLTNTGGAIVVFDKCVPNTGYVSTVLWRLALAGKIHNGVKAEDVIAKELSLSGVQRPLDMKELNGAVEVFRFGDFAGWIIESSK